MSYPSTEEGRRAWVAASRLSFGQRWAALSIMGRVNYVLLRAVAVVIVALALRALYVAPPPALSSALFTSLAFPLYWHALHAAFVRRIYRARSPRPSKAVTLDLLAALAAVALGVFVLLRSYVLLWPPADSPTFFNPEPPPLYQLVRWVRLVSKYLAVALFGLGVVALARALRRCTDDSAELPPASGLFTYGLGSVFASVVFLLISHLHRLGSSGCIMPCDDPIGR